ncbi:efflux RND transporter periplasmic adaptor subunit [Phycisphaerales bacterium AB-hyl4]|uniref:Efflux RND transporter periplasmic adaptor subunit n=1 Tax=Natronomicrosphaera hydrolytica TaxID=3242702 RepID=A0ABV4U597_9BACT
MIGIIVAVVAAAVWAMMPRPVPVDLEPVVRGSLRVTVDEDGRTRVRDRYVVSSPLAGRLRRIMLDPGDAVRANETVLAIVDPPSPALLDARMRREAQARLEAAEAGASQAQAQVEQTQGMVQLARNERRRLEQLVETAAAPRRELEDAQLIEQTRERELEAARWGQRVAEHQRELAEAALLQVEAGDDADVAREPMAIDSPVNGRVLRVLQRDAAVVSPGTALLEVGDVGQLEVVVDVLSADAVRIRPGMAVLFERWGGDEAVTGVVRLVEPSAFTDVSALGVEEQRVNVIVDLEAVDPASQLGDGYRMHARIVLWQAADVLTVPTSALFRDGQQWAVFVMEAERATLRHVELGRQTGLTAEVRAGLAEDELVIAYPSDRITDGTRVEPR